MNTVLDQPVLVLNRYWQPVQTCSVRRAVHLLCVGHARVVQTDGENQFQTHDLGSWMDYSTCSTEGDFIHTVRLAVRVPSILVLGLYDKIPRLEVKFTRRNVFLRDQFTCQYCAKALPEPQLNLDHVIPRQKGGRTTWENIVTSCVRCNTRKANKLPQEADMHPLHKPVAPRWKPLFGIRENGLGDVSWAHFIDPDSGAIRLSA
ncbi:MAG: HNH endonuclease [Verrucomicrobiales bacterium VVV1]|nr:MAG: HNH endonuclease [Verrucomicrobiales bacterium VVV1]